MSNILKAVWSQRTDFAVTAGAKMALGSDGSLYVAGKASRDKLRETRWGSQYDQDGFLSKYSKNGSLAWTNYLGSDVANDSVRAIDIGNDGSVYVALYSEDDRSSIRSRKTYLSAHSERGGEIWSVPIIGDDGSSEVYPNGLSALSDGSIFLVGSTNARVFFGRSLSSVNRADSNGIAFYSKFTKDGADTHHGFIKAQSADGVSDGSNKTFLIYGDLQNGSASNIDTYLMSQWPSGPFAYRSSLFDSFAHPAEFFGGSGADYVSATTVANDGSIYVAGTTNSSFYGGSANSGKSDIFMTKYSASGQRIFTSLIGGSGNDYVQDMVIGGDGFLYLAGTTFSNSFNGKQSPDGNFISKYSLTGKEKWTHFDSESRWLVQGIEVDKDGSVYHLSKVDSTRPVDGGIGLSQMLLRRFDVVSSSSANRETITGSIKNDKLKGKKAAVYLQGVGGNDKLTGSSKDDILDGGDGNDVLTGKKGADAYVLSSGNDKFKGFKLKEGDTIQIDSGITYSLVQSKKNTLIKHDDGVTTVFKANKDDLTSVIELVT